MSRGESEARELIDWVNTEVPGLTADGPIGPIGVPATVQITFDIGISRETIDEIRSRGFVIDQIASNEMLWVEYDE